METKFSFYYLRSLSVLSSDVIIYTLLKKNKGPFCLQLSDFLLIRVSDINKALTIGHKFQTVQAAESRINYNSN